MYSHFYFFYRGFVVKLSCTSYAKGEISFQKYPLELEGYRRQVQERVAEALLEYGYYGDGKSPINAKFIEDGVNPTCL